MAYQENPPKIPMSAIQWDEIGTEENPRARLLAHIDIAGMAWSDKPGRTWGKGATGYGVRLIDRLVSDTVEG